MRKISDEDVARLRDVLNRLREFHDDWDKREDDPKDMTMPFLLAASLIDAPEMVAKLIPEMEGVMRRLDEARDQP